MVVGFFALVERSMATFRHSILLRKTPKNAFARGIFLFRAGRRISLRRAAGNLQMAWRELAGIFIPLI
jgi:hypothetical protein